MRMDPMINSVISALLGAFLSLLIAKWNYNRQNDREKKQLLRETRKELHELVSQTIIPFWVGRVRGDVKEIQIKMHLRSISNDLAKYEDFNRQIQILRMRCTGGAFETADFGKNTFQTQKQIELINGSWEQLDQLISDFI